MPMNFPSEKELRKHARRHWNEFNLPNEHASAEYLALARAFCECECPTGTEECTKTSGKINRFCEASAEFAVMLPIYAYILTFHVLHPRGFPGIPIEKTHAFDTNREYYQDDCGH